jgi:hypothetical protein
MTRQPPIRYDDVKRSMGMLIHEDLARARIRERHEQARAEGLADRVAAVRRWQRRAAAAERRARAARDALI